MKMVAHQNIGEELDVGKAEMVRELGEKALAVGLVVEDCRAAVSAAGDVIQGIGKINPWRARHGLNVDSQPAPTRPYSRKSRSDPVICARDLTGSRSALIVPAKRGNKRPCGPRGGKRGIGSMESLLGHTTDTGDSMYVLPKQQRIAELARQSPQTAFTTLAHLMDIDWLDAAFARTRKDRAAGVDGQTWHDYERNLKENLQSLLDRAKSGTYRAPPVRRVHIPKGGSTTETRPVGIPTLEDKVLQRAVVMLLEPIYEQDFDPGSYGFRPGRSAHAALEDLRQQAMANHGGRVLEVDIRKFFDTLDHAHLRQLIQLRVRDGVVLRLIGKWLNAGVMEDGNISYPETGSPQGGVISPLLANVYSALRAGHVVSPGGATATPGQGPPDPLCGRLRDSVHE